MNLVNGYGQAIQLGSGSCIFNASKVEVSNQVWFTGASSSAYGTSGQVMACTTDEKFFWNGKLATNGSYTTPRMLSALPNADGIYDTSVRIGEALTANEDGSYTATADGAVFFPITFNSGSSIEKYLANGGTYHGNGTWFVQKGAQIDPYFAMNFPENHVFHANPSPFDLAGLLKNYIPMVGAKVAILGDSLSEQSAGYTGSRDAYGFYQGEYNHDGWFSRIARKYSMDYRVHGYGMQWWYCTDGRPNGGVKAVNSLMESGYQPDYIVLEYGTNDVWSGSLGEAADTADSGAASTAGAMRYCIETLQAQLPTAKIIVIMPCMRGVNDEKQAAYYTMANAILDEYGIRRVDMAHHSGITAAMMNPDGVHLALSASNGYDNTTEAVARYSRCLEAEMLNL
jgi:lysophospholipase L1-like esterase